MKEKRITLFRFVPSVVRSMMQLPGAKQAFAHLRVLSLIGEPMSRDDVALFRSVLPPGCQINFSLGSTEAGGLTRWFVREEMITGLRAPIGFVAPGRRIAIVNEAGNSVASGETGELIISDAFVALGDWRNNKVDAGRFPTDPDTGWRLYSSGDLVRERADGLIEFVGRRDRMVKIRGLRVELGEVETAIRAAPGVADAVVVAKDRGDDHTTLAAFVVPMLGATVSNADLRAYVSTYASPQAVPTEFAIVPSIPRLSNGKPDLMQLRQRTSPQGVP
jgi:acyl-coenzyme A synthetase/AMP-(fatty) acid ligase